MSSFYQKQESHNNYTKLQAKQNYKYYYFCNRTEKNLWLKELGNHALHIFIQKTLAMFDVLSIT